MQTSDIGRPRRIHLNSLTSLRFFAAVFVVFFHVSQKFEEMSVFSPIVGFGYTGVSFFFVLSGFVLAWSQNPQQSHVEFYWRRFARVWPLHALTTGLAVVMVLLATSTAVWPALPFVVTLTQAWIPDGNFRYSFNSVSWSLSCEAFFYLAFPFLAVYLEKRVRYIWIVAGIIVLMGVVGFVGVLLLPGHALGYLFYTMPLFRLGEFVIGICLAMALRNGWRPRLSFRSACGVVLLTYVTLMLLTVAAVGNPARLPYVVADMWMLPGFVLVIVASATNDINKASGFLGSRILVRLGQWSFALYMVHELILKAMEPWVNGLSFALTSVVSILVVLFAIAVSGALFEYFEQPVERRLRSIRLIGMSSNTGARDST